MGRGAIYDRLGGGFHRCTLDRQWRIPHFEKMLYDNALIAELLAEITYWTGDAELDRLTRGTLDFLLTAMRVPNGAFRSAVDAETDGEERAFYLWKRTELEKVLGPQEFDLLAPLLGFNGPPNFEVRAYTLCWTQPLAVLTAERGVEPRELWPQHKRRWRVQRSSICHPGPVPGQR